MKLEHTHAYEGKLDHKHHSHVDMMKKHSDGGHVHHSEHYSKHSGGHELHHKAINGFCGGGMAKGKK